MKTSVEMRNINKKLFFFYPANQGSHSDYIEVIDIWLYHQLTEVWHAELFGDNIMDF